MELITKQFRAALSKALAAAEKEGFSAVEVRAENLSRRTKSSTRHAVAMGPA